MTKLTSHPEFDEAAAQFIAALDMPECATEPMATLIGCSLVRVYLRDWLQQDAIDARWVSVGEDIDGIPIWHRVDGWPERGEGEAVIGRKWMQRAQLWIGWNSMDVWHVIDWLSVAERDNHPWFFNVDTDGYPKKLTKCATLERLALEASKGLQHRTNPQSALVIARDEETHIADLGDGYSMVQILTPTALCREGIRMHNCLRHGDHGKSLTDRNTRFYSVRDSHDKPVGTLEVYQCHVRQFAGPCNIAPTSDVIDRVAAVAAARGWHGLYTATLEFSEPDDDDVVIIPAAFENRRRI